MRKLIGNNWDDILAPQFEAEYYLKLREFLKTEYRSHAIYPSMHDIFNALKLTPPEAVRAVIIGQDPYINPGQAHGLAFSVKEGIEPPPSLKNIFEEIKTDLGLEIPQTGHLEAWAKQGVLLLNTALTVRAGASNSHAGNGWEQLTDSVIAHIGTQNTPTAYLLWGRNAQSKANLVANPSHLVLKAPHPSPLSAHRGFFGCKHFSKTNAYLSENNLPPINWAL